MEKFAYILYIYNVAIYIYIYIYTIYIFLVVGWPVGTGILCMLVGFLYHGLRVCAAFRLCLTESLSANPCHSLGLITGGLKALESLGKLA